MKMKLSDFVEYSTKKIAFNLERTGRTGYANLLWGAPGIGKSSIMHEITSIMQEITGEPWGLIDARLSQLDAVDLRGVPDLDRENGVTRWLSPSWLPNEKRHGKYGILLLDEIFQGQPSTQSGAMQLVLDGKLGDYVKPAGWHVMGCSNRDCDRAAISRLQNSALDNRFTHTEIVLDANDWLAWAAAHDIVPEVMAYIGFRPDQIHAYPEGNIPKNVKAFATPRTWEEASNTIKLGLREELEHAVLCGTIGEVHASELAGYLRVYREIPDIDGVFIDPTEAPLPEDPGTMYAIASLIGYKVNQANFKAGITYVERMGGEFAALLVKLATARDAKLKNTTAFTEFKVRHQELGL